VWCYLHLNATYFDLGCRFMKKISRNLMKKDKGEKYANESAAIANRGIAEKKSVEKLTIHCRVWLWGQWGLLVLRSYGAVTWRLCGWPLSFSSTF
jgi:hypothetical protein